MKKTEGKQESKYYVVPFRDLVSVPSRIEVQLEISDAVAAFLSENFPQKEPSIPTVSRVFSKNLIENKPKWNIQTVMNFFKFIMLRRDIDEFRDVVKYGRPVTALVLLDWVYLFENERAVEKHKEASVPSTVKSTPEKVDVFVKSILDKIPQPPPPEPIIRQTQESDKKDLLQIIWGLSIPELKELKSKLIEHSKVIREDGKLIEVFYYNEEIELINKRLSETKSKGSV